MTVKQYNPKILPSIYRDLKTLNKLCQPSTIEDYLQTLVLHLSYNITFVPDDITRTP